MPEPQAQIYEFGDFRVDAAKRLLLKRDGETVPLTPKAFDTLLYLVEHREAVLDKEELLKAIWPDTVVEENNLNQNISALRRVLGENTRRASLHRDRSGAWLPFRRRGANTHDAHRNSRRRDSQSHRSPAAYAFSGRAQGCSFGTGNG